MCRKLLAFLAAGLCIAFGGAGSVAALELNTSIDLDYSYAQEDLGGDVKATTQYNQKYGLDYATSLTTSYEFLGAVRVDLQDAWFTDQAGTSRLAPTLEMGAKGPRLAAKIAFDTMTSTTDSYQEMAEVTTYSSSLALDLELTPVLWPEVKLKYMRRGDYQDYTKEHNSNSFEFSTRKNIYGLRLEGSFKREYVENLLPTHSNSLATSWAAKAAYKGMLWGGTEFELAYEINEGYKEESAKGVFTGDTASYSQVLKTRLRNSLDIGPRMTIGMGWEYQFEQDLLALDYDFKLTNKYALDLRWEVFDWLKITGDAQRETDLKEAVVGDDERAVIDTLKAAFDITSISWLLVSGKAEFKSEDKITVDTGGSIDKVDEDKYELVVKNRLGDYWDFTWDATTSNKRTDGWLSNRETKVKADLKFKLLGLAVTPGYEVTRTNEWERLFDFPVNQEQTREAKIRFEYQLQLVDLFKATFSHEYGIEVDDSLDEVLNFERQLQFSEDTRITIVLAEIVRDVHMEGEIDRKASDTEDDPDPEIVEISYSLKLDWRLDQLTLMSSLKYNDKGDTFDDVSFNVRAGWKIMNMDLTGEYQFDKIIKDSTEPKDEKRKLNLKLNYKF